MADRLKCRLVCVVNDFDFTRSDNSFMTVFPFYEKDAERAYETLTRSTDFDPETQAGDLPVISLHLVGY